MFIETILQKQNAPMRLEDLALITGIPLTTDAELLTRFKAHDRVLYDAKTDLYSYRVRSCYFCASFPSYSHIHPA